MLTSAATMTDQEFQAELGLLMAEPIKIRHYGRYWDVDDARQLAAMRCLDWFRAGEIEDKAALRLLFRRKVREQGRKQHVRDCRGKRDTRQTEGLIGDCSAPNLSESQVEASELQAQLVARLGCEAILSDLVEGYSKTEIQHRHGISDRRLRTIVAKAQEILANS